MEAESAAAAAEIANGLAQDAVNAASAAEDAAIEADRLATKAKTDAEAKL